MDVIQIIDELEQEFITSKNFLWSKKTLVNMDRCASLIAELKANLPSAIQEASYVLSKKDQIIANANDEANKILTDARYRADQIVNTTEIVKQSEMQSRKILTDTTHKCSELYNVTRNNIDKMLKSVETYLDQNLLIVRRNREELDNTINRLQYEDDRDN